jgi:membrane associated rhomboid family serine protease
MFFFLPYGTDAPIYHWPKATVGLIVVTTVAFFASLSLSEEEIHKYALALGDGIHPLQWFTSLFLHVGPGHLIGNMIFLWVFGLVVEGKVGSLWFLALYLTAGVLESAITQLVQLHTEPTFGVGASGAIYGLLAICLIWAPRNDLNCFFFAMVFIRIITFTVDVPILLFALFYIGMEVFWVVVTKAAMSSAFFHATGALVGLVLGVLMLKLNLVDCENWDIFAVMQGRQGRTKEQDARRRERIAPRPDEVSPRKAKASKGKKKAASNSMEDPAQAATTRFRQALREEGPDAAFISYNRAVRTVAGWHPGPTDWHELIRVLINAKLWRPAITVMEDYLRRANDPSPRVRLTLAQVLVREPQRPAHALRVLADLPEDSLPDDLKKQRRKIVKKAEQMIEDGVYELDGEAW